MDRCILLITVMVSLMIFISSSSASDSGSRSKGKGKRPIQDEDEDQTVGDEFPEYGPHSGEFYDKTERVYEDPFPDIFLKNTEQGQLDEGLSSRETEDMYNAMRDLNVSENREIQPDEKTMRVLEDTYFPDIFLEDHTYAGTSREEVKQEDIKKEEFQDPGDLLDDETMSALIAAIPDLIIKRTKEDRLKARQTFKPPKKEEKKMKKIEDEKIDKALEKPSKGKKAHRSVPYEQKKKENLRYQLKLKSDAGRLATRKQKLKLGYQKKQENWLKVKQGLHVQEDNEDQQDEYDDQDLHDE